MICTRLLSPIKNHQQKTILPIIEVDDFVIYKMISSDLFYNAKAINQYLNLKNDDLKEIFFDENVYFICSNKLFDNEFEKDHQLIKELKNSIYFHEFVLKQLKNFKEIVTNDGNGGSLILFDYMRGYHKPFFVFSDIEQTKKELDYLLELPEIKEDINYYLPLYDNYITKLKKANEAFNNKTSQIFLFVDQLLKNKIDAIIEDIENNVK